MKLAIIGSRGIIISDLEKYISKDVTEIVSGGAKDVDTCAKEYAQKHNLKLTEFLPDYQRYKRGAPLRRNLQIIEYADAVLAFWDGESRGTKHVIDVCNKTGKKIVVQLIQSEK